MSNEKMADSMYVPPRESKTAKSKKSLSTFITLAYIVLMPVTFLLAFPKVSAAYIGSGEEYTSEKIESCLDVLQEFSTSPKTVKTAGYSEVNCNSIVGRYLAGDIPQEFQERHLSLHARDQLQLLRQRYQGNATKNKTKLFK